MASLTRNMAFTSQMLGFARTQLGFLTPELNVYEQRVLKHAFISQAVSAFLSYLEEIDLLSSRDLPLVNLTAFLRNRLQNKSLLKDFRVEEIHQLLFGNNNEQWLMDLLALYEQSQHTTVIERKVPQEEGSQGNLIIAVAEEKRLPLWWDHDKTALTRLLTLLEELIARQREVSTEA